MNPDKSPGSDGFQAFFFKKYLHILGEDLYVGIEATINPSSLLIDINNTFITLIPKKNDHIDPRDFHSISLCKNIYKFLSKTITNRIKLVLPKLISEEKIGFIPNRSILDGIIIIQEIMHSVQT